MSKPAQNAAKIEEQDKVIWRKTRQNQNSIPNFPDAKTAEQTAKDESVAAQKPTITLQKLLQCQEKAVEDKKAALNQTAQLS